jgi:ubiquitin-conjugating enzyme (huntingtin interacting protein 2)
MSGPDKTRLRKEMIECGKDFEKSGVYAEPVGDDLSHLKGKIKGPEDTPYQGGVFDVDIHIPRGYPFEPPKMRFMTQMWHPNVSSQTGAICLDILKDQWSPALTVKTALLSLQALLSAPEPNDPQDAQVASQYKKDYKTWCKTAKFWTESYAMGPAAAAAARVAAATAAAAAAAAGSSSGSGSGASAPAPAPAPAPKPAAPTDPRLQQLIDMGFERGRAAAALKAKMNNLEAAVEYLFSTS